MKDNKKESVRIPETKKKSRDASPRKDRISFKSARHSARGTYGSNAGAYGTDYTKGGSAHTTNRFSVVESYKTLRTNLQFSMTKKGCNVVIITSTLPRDGKSTVAANIAVAFAQTDMRVLLIDADMRKPRLNKFFNIPAVPGLSNILAGLSPVPEGVHSSEFKNLHVIPSGILPPNPAELLMSGAMEDLIAVMRLQYDLILLDTPPVNIVSDAVVVTKYADGVVLVVRHAVTTHPDIERAIKGLEFANAKILGIVLNAIDYAKVYGRRYISNYQKTSKYGAYYGKSGYGGTYAAQKDSTGASSPPSSADRPLTDNHADEEMDTAYAPVEARPSVIPERVDL
jgi:capsular exopolysaccharide synthesis family protein